MISLMAPILVSVHCSQVTSSSPMLSAFVYADCQLLNLYLLIWITRLIFRCLLSLCIEMSNRSVRCNITKPEFFIFFSQNLLLFQLPSLQPKNNLKLKIQQLSLILFSPLPFRTPLLCQCSLPINCYINNFEKLTINDSHLYTCYESNYCSFTYHISYF